jgi:hypothetical protein
MEIKRYWSQSKAKISFVTSIELDQQFEKMKMYIQVEWIH